MKTAASSHRTDVRADGALSDSLERCSLAIVIGIAALIFLGTIVSPPSLVDDVDSVHAAIARTMLRSGDWVTARLDGVAYLDKSPMTYWVIAASYALFGVHDWAARIPLALSAILLCGVTVLFGAWAFGRKAGFYAGLALATCAGLFLFTRILIPEVMLTLSVTVTMWAFLRLVEENEPRPRLWAALMGASLGAGLLMKGLLAGVAPAGGAFVYLLVTRQLFSWDIGKRLRPLLVLTVAILVAAPWYVLATLQNPPYIDFTLRIPQGGTGQYRGFFWRYFINEHVLRFLGERYPRDYNTVPRLQFWLLHLVWLFPWSAYFPAAARLSYQPKDRAGRVRLLAVCWTAFLLVFFTFSTTQEYYSVPVYPALALLAGSAIASGGKWVTWGTRAAATVAALAAVATVALLVLTRNTPTPGDIATALAQNPEAYTLSLGHMQDLTLASFAYLRLPLVVAAIAFTLGAVCGWVFTCERGHLAFALMMVLFVHAARLAMVEFDPYLSSRPLAEALLKSPPGGMIVDDQYYTFSSVFFYADREGLLLNGRINNLEYGSYALGAPEVFIDDGRFRELWQSPERYYLLAAGTAVPRLEKLAGPERMYTIARSGGKALVSNQPIR
jgi:4-amino-4-deoxy-L-arabinose transferase-like glycosyltransferase